MSRVLIQYFAAACLLLPITICYGQSDLAFAKNIQIEFELFAGKEGLDNLYINDIVKDSQGFLWLATQNGLYRFDGTRFYHALPNDANGEAINLNINALTIDDNDRLYLGTRHHGIVQLHLPTAEWQFDLQPRLQQQVLSYRDLQRVGTSLFAITNDGALIQWQLDKQQAKVLNPELKILQLHLGRSGKLYIASETGVWQYNFQFQRLLRLDIAVEPGASISRIHEDAGANLWVATNGKGVQLYQRKQNQWVAMLESHQLALAATRVVDIAENSQGFVYVIGEDASSVYNPEWQRFESLDLSLQPQRLYIDNQDTLWLAVWGQGLLGANPYFSRFSVFKQSAQQPSQLPVADIQDIQIDPLNNLWVAHDQGISVFDQRLGQFSHFNRFLAEGDRPKSLLSAGRHLLLISEQNQVFKFNHTLQKFELILSFSAAEQSHYFFNHSGKLWRLSAGLLQQFNLEGKVETNQSLQQLGLAHNTVSAIRVDSQEQVWLLTEKDGIYLYSQDTDKLTRLTVDGQNPFVGEPVTAWNEDNQGNIWLANKQGIYHWAGNQWQYWNSGVDIPRLQASAIFSDINDQAWAVTAHGVVTLVDNRWQLAIPLPPSVTHQPAATIRHAREGLVAMANAKQVLILDLQQKLAPLQTPVLVSEVRVTGQDLLLQQPFPPLAVPYLNQLKLSADQDSLQLKLSFLEAGLTDNYQLHYLEENNWLAIDDSQLLLSQLDAGRYNLVFRVGSSASNAVNRNLAIEISQPWWWSNMARIGYLIIIACIMALGVYYELLFRRRRNQEAKRLKQLNERLELSLMSSGDEVWDWDIKNSQLHRLNKEVHWSRLADFSESKDFLDFVFDQDLARFNHTLVEVLKGKQEYLDMMIRVRGSEQDWVWVVVKGRVVERDEDGRATRLIGALHNIDQIKRTKERLRLIATSFENTFDGVWISDANKRILSVNKAYCSIRLVSEEDILGERVSLAFVKGQDDKLENMMWDVLDKLGHWQAEMWDVRSTGEAYPMEISIDAVKDENDIVTNYVGVFSDITFKKQAENELRQLANYDALTHLPNKTFLYALLQQALHHCRQTESKAGIILLDLDDFKDINDSLGHSVGDKLLKIIAERIKKQLDESDVLARIGGDEFAIMVDSAANSDLLADKAVKCLEALQKPFLIDEHALKIGVSMGVAQYPEDGQDVETLIRNADTAMHHQKRVGKAGYQFYSHEMNRRLLERIELDTNLRHAIVNDEFILQYQPKITVDKRQCEGMEALVRWIREDGQFVSPGLFIPFAEDSGLIVEIGELILRKACVETKPLFSSGKMPGRLAVNLSAKQFVQDNIVDRIMQILLETKFDPRWLELEITEGAVMHHTDSAIEKMRHFRAIGIELSIDDFGTGYSSLAYLKQFPVSTLKIDRSFIIEIQHTEADQKIVGAVVNLAHSLNLKVVAEGVEEEEQTSILKRLNCDVIQGYFYSKPLILDDLSAFVDNWAQTKIKLHRQS